MKKRFKAVLAGNPNCGKTSIFNALTGARQHVGNYSGVTVESKSGFFEIGDISVEIVDLPGIYSLSSGSPEEKIAFAELTKKGVDLIINVVDSSIPRRNLYLTTQLAELGIPMVLAFNMSDDAKKKGLSFDMPKLEKYFGAPIVQTIGRTGSGIEELASKIAKTLKLQTRSARPMPAYGTDTDDAIRAVSEAVEKYGGKNISHIPARFFAIKLLENDSCVAAIPELNQAKPEALNQMRHLREKHAIDPESYMADRRYAMIAGACAGAVSASRERRREISDKIDAVMANKFFGFPLFLIIIYLTFFFTFTCAQPFMDWIEAAFSFMSDSVKAAWDENTLPFWRSLLTDGIIGGVGGVIVFLPNILFLFFAIAILEDSGYMARAAFIMDGIMRKFGLQGRSFVPLVLGFGCNVPAIMATRCIESERDRTVTIMVLPLMSCGARLPIYALVIPAFFAAEYQAAMMWIIYIIGVAVALLAAKIMRNTLFKGDGEIYLMELPPYRIPTVRSLLLHMWDRGKIYLHKAGTIILATSVLLFIANTYPQKTVFSKDYDAIAEQAMKTGKEKGEPEEKINGIIAALENEKSSEMLEYTASGRIGKFLEPMFSPIGFDWKLTTASIGALAAKEVFVSQLGILYAEGETDENSDTLRERLAKNYTPAQGFCIMLFSLMSIPCLATLAVMKRELNSWKLMLVEALALFAVAYAATAAVYQTCLLFGIGTKLIP